MYPSITIIGAGNVGHHLALKLHQEGYLIQQIFSRKIAKAQALAKQVNAKACNNLATLSQDADIYIVSIKDDGISTLAKAIAFLDLNHKIVAHTSGSTAMDVFAPYFKNFGIFYPLQTFSVHKAVDFQQLPFCINANNPKTQKSLMTLAKSICPNVYEIDDQQRSILHVTAVMVNNFSNHLFSIAQQICTDKNVPFEILLPLIQETTEKIKHSAPPVAQTGPAVRGDQKTIERHLEFLDAYPHYQEVYRILSQSIQNFHNSL